MNIAIKRAQNVSNLCVTSVAALLLWSCDVKDPIYETCHPNQGKIILTTDWTNRTAGIDLPASYTVKVGNYSETLSRTTHTVNHLFAPGNYSLYVYNQADNITVSGTTTTANYTAGALGWLFTHHMDVAIKKDKAHKLTAVMAQQVRQLTLVVKPTGGMSYRIERITATLSGIAGSYDMASDAHGAASNVGITFLKSETAEYPGKWMATVRLLGVAGSEQKLTGVISFTGGIPADMALESDLTTPLAAFNADKKTPLILDGQAVETPNGTGFTAIITDWNSVNGGSVVAN